MATGEMGNDKESQSDQSDLAKELLNKFRLPKAPQKKEEKAKEEEINKYLVPGILFLLLLLTLFAFVVYFVNKSNQFEKVTTTSAVVPAPPPQQVKQVETKKRSEEIMPNTKSVETVVVPTPVVQPTTIINPESFPCKNEDEVEAGFAFAVPTWLAPGQVMKINPGCVLIAIERNVSEIELIADGRYAFAIRLDNGDLAVRGTVYGQNNTVHETQEFLFRTKGGKIRVDMFGEANITIIAK